MIQKIKDYTLFILLALLGVAYYMLGRRGEKIKDLQEDLIKKDLDVALGQAKEDMATKEKSYEDALRDYAAKRDRYNKLFRDK